MDETEMQKTDATAATAVEEKSKVQEKSEPHPDIRSASANEHDDELDDLDELDDMLDEFQIQESQLSQQPKGDARAGAIEEETERSAMDDDFAAQLQHGMTDLLQEMNNSKELQDQFEKLVKELNDSASVTADSDSPLPTAGTSRGPSAPGRETGDATSSPTNFQDRIKQAMDKMKTSEAEMDAAAVDSESNDFLSEMLRQMQSTSEHGGNEEEFSTMLVNMMEQLTSKDILYEPMKELFDKYPAWLRENEGKHKTEDMKRYNEQLDTVTRIVRKFEEPGYKDEDDVCRGYIIEQMQKMQSAGSPPQELMGDVGQGIPDIPQDADPDCGVQ